MSSGFTLSNIYNNALLSAGVMGYENQHAQGAFGAPEATDKSLYYCVVGGANTNITTVSTNPLGTKKIKIKDLGFMRGGGLIGSTTKARAFFATDAATNSAQGTGNEDLFKRNIGASVFSTGAGRALDRKGNVLNDPNVLGHTYTFESNSNHLSANQSGNANPTFVASSGGIDGAIKITLSAIQLLGGSLTGKFGKVNGKEIPKASVHVTGQGQFFGAGETITIKTASFSREIAGTEVYITSGADIVFEVKRTKQGLQPAGIIYNENEVANSLAVGNSGGPVEYTLANVGGAGRAATITSNASGFKVGVISYDKSDGGHYVQEYDTNAAFPKGIGGQGVDASGSHTLHASATSIGKIQGPQERSRKILLGF